MIEINLYDFCEIMFKSNVESFFFIESPLLKYFLGYWKTAKEDFIDSIIINHSVDKRVVSIYGSGLVIPNVFLDEHLNVENFKKSILFIEKEMLFDSIFK